MAVQAQVSADELARRLRPFAHHYAVQIVLVPAVTGITELGRTDRAPFHSGLGMVRERGRAVLYTADAPAPGIIHELGHVLFDPAVGPMGDEFRWFGWEHALACRIGVDEQWREDNKRYNVTESGIEFGQLSRQQQDVLLEDRKDAAAALGYLRHLPQIGKDGKTTMGNTEHPQDLLGKTIMDNDPRMGGRTGQVLAREQDLVLVHWSTGRKTRIRIDRIGKAAKTGYSVVS